MYLTVANNTYHNAHQDDVFFTKAKKTEREYTIINDRKQAFVTRIRETLQIMIRGHKELSNETVWIGH